MRIKWFLNLLEKQTVSVRKLGKKNRFLDGLYIRRYYVQPGTFGTGEKCRIW